MDTPRDGLVRALRENIADIEVREASDGDGPIMSGHFARFGEWTTINSVYEGQFLERVAPGAFSKTIKENRAGVKVLFNHGHDTLGNMVLGTIRSLSEDDQGAAYEVDLFDGIDPLIMSGLRSGAYGASFRFAVVKDDWVDEPSRSADNPDALPERTLREVKLFEFGPVTFPAYGGATAGVRSLSLTDDWMRHQAHDLGTPDPGAAAPTEQEPQTLHSGPDPRERRRRSLQLRGVLP